MCETGRGVEQDFYLAAYWYRKAADQGDDFAQKRISAMYVEGKIN
jgi:uncharacterized protein